MCFFVEVGAIVFWPVEVLLGCLGFSQVAGWVFFSWGLFAGEISPTFPMASLLP